MKARLNNSLKMCKIFAISKNIKSNMKNRLVHRSGFNKVLGIHRGTKVMEEMMVTLSTNFLIQLLGEKSTHVQRFTRGEGANNLQSDNMCPMILLGSSNAIYVYRFSV